MDAVECKGLLYNIFSEEPFKNQRIHMTEKYMIILYLIIFSSFGMLIVKTMTCLSCYQNKRPKLIKDGSFIMSLGEILSEKNS